jgi:hypothetical protein
MTLLAIEDPEKIQKEAEVGPQWLPLVTLAGTGFGRCLLKLKYCGCSEVLGYQLAQRLRVPVAPAVPLWSPQAFRHGCETAGEGRVGLAIDYSKEIKNLMWEAAAKQAPETVATCLALCVLNRDEWGVLAESDFGLIFYDLEGLFPHFTPECSEGRTWEEVADEVSRDAENYQIPSLSFALVREAIAEGEKLGLGIPLRRAVKEAASISLEELLKIFDLEPHPLGSKICMAAAKAAKERFDLAARILNI